LKFYFDEFHFYVRPLLLVWLAKKAHTNLTASLWKPGRCREKCRKKYSPRLAQKWSWAETRWRGSRACAPATPRLRTPGLSSKRNLEKISKFRTYSPKVHDKNFSFYFYFQKIIFYEFQKMLDMYKIRFYGFFQLKQC